MFRIKSSTLWLANFLVISLTTAIFLSACGFKPMHAKKEGTSGICNNFKVLKADNNSVSKQKLRYKLQDRLNQSCINPDKNYVIETNISRVRDSIGIQPDRAVTRYNVTVSGSFSIKDVATGKVVETVHSSITGGYDDVVSDYGTYALELDTESKLMQEMAEDVALKIATNLYQ